MSQTNPDEFWLDELCGSYKTVIHNILSRNPHPTKEKANSTKKEYATIFTRYERATYHDWEKIKAMMGIHRCKRTWNKDRAALLYSYRNLLESDVEIIDKSNGQTEVGQQIENCEWNINIIEKLMGLSYRGPRKPVASKRKILSELPSDWRELIYKRTNKYKEALLVATLSGCRPSELVNGVKVEVENGKLIMTIKGTKVTDYSGQPWRKIQMMIQGKYAQELAKYVGLAGGKKTVSIESATNFTATIKSAVKKEPTLKQFKISAYCYRHQMASDLKLHMKEYGTDEIQISEILGHYSSNTKQAYGYPRSGKSMVSPIIHVETSRLVKVIPNTPPYSAKRNRKIKV